MLQLLLAIFKWSDISSFAGILGESESLLRGAAKAPLPGVPNVTTGVFLAREAANVTGLANATKSLQQQAQTARVPGNVTQVRVMSA